MPTHLILLQLATLVTLGMKQKLWNSSLKSTFPSHRQISPCKNSIYFVFVCLFKEAVTEFITSAQRIINGQHMVFPTML